jgi:cell wall-associated NlpC family hydrolase
MEQVKTLLTIGVVLFAFSGCASAPVAPAASAGSTKPSAADRGAAAAALAAKMVGKPYKYGGSSPSGFDCSGLVSYSFKQAGVALPHNTAQQRTTSRLIKVAELRRGDLLFFDQEGKKHGHVAIYLGEGRFVHAPSSGKSVRTDALSNPYWKKHLTEARRPV